MMQIVYFSQREQFLNSIELYSGEKVLITTSPLKADGLRNSLQNIKIECDVLTIAKFTSNLIQELWSTGDRPEVKRKSELLLTFGLLKNKYLPKLGFEQFTQAYNLFSDLRSFTLNEETLASVLEEQSEEIRQAVKLFWRLVEVTGYCDEHLAYHKISESLRTHDEIKSLKKNILLLGISAFKWSTN